jgi:hypothetical protein
VKRSFWLRILELLRAAGPLLLALPLVPALTTLVLSSRHLALGRDQGIFQYIAWALSQGAVDYRDIRDVNGPLIHWIHQVFLMLGGESEVRFRTLDLLVSCFVFASFGASLARERSLKVSAALLALVLLLGQYVRYLWWDLAQRESFCDWFVLGAASLLIGKRSRTRDALAGALLMLSAFGKPTYAIFLLFAGVSILWASRSTKALLSLRSSAKALLSLGAGAVVAGTTVLLALQIKGSLSAFVQIYLVDARVMYAYIWPNTPRELLAFVWVRTPLLIGALAVAIGSLALWANVLPKRALFIVLMPVGGAVSLFVQKKGFPYHAHPVTAGASAIVLTVLVSLFKRVQGVQGVQGLSASRVRKEGAVLVVAAALVAGYETWTTSHCWIAANPWISDSNDLARYRTSDFFPDHILEAAVFLRSHTSEKDCVQTYGMDPYVLFLAKRLSCSPFIYAYDLNTDAAYNGAMETLAPPRNQIVAAQIRALGAAHAKQMLEALAEEPPKAWVLFDGAPLSSYPTALEDLQRTQTEIAELLKRDFAPAATFGTVQVWLPRL